MGPYRCTAAHNKQHTATMEYEVNNKQKSLEEKPAFIRTIGLFTAVSITIGHIVGAGIFVSPKGVLLGTQSAGLSLIVWVLCGVLCTCQALCYVELATMLKESGGVWTFIRRGLGGAPAFVVAVCWLIVDGAGTALSCQVSATYVLLPFIDQCGVPPLAVKLMAICFLMLVVSTNTSTSLTKKVLKVALVMKVVTMTTIIIGGLYWMATYGGGDLSTPFRGTTGNGWSVALSFYGGLFAYRGFQNITNVTEEIKDYKRNIPLCVFISLSSVTVFYLLINLSYYAVLGTDLVLTSDVVVLEWGKGVFGRWGITFSFLVALSALGGMLSSTFSMSRQLLCLARAGHTVELLAMVDVKQSIPFISLGFKALLVFTFVMVADSIQTMLNFVTFLSILVETLVYVSLAKLKIQKYNDDQERFRVPLPLPIIMILINIYLALVPVINDPQWFFLYGSLIALASLVLYFPFVKFNYRLPCFDKVTLFLQMLCGVAVVDKDN